MIEETKAISNSHVMVAYTIPQQVVTVRNKATGRDSFFAGWDGLYDLFSSCYVGFSEETNFEDVINHMKPVIGNCIVNK